MQNLISHLQISTYILIVIHFLRMMLRKIFKCKPRKKPGCFTDSKKEPTNLDRYFGWRTEEVNWDEFRFKVVMFYRCSNIINATEFYAKTLGAANSLQQLFCTMHYAPQEAIFLYNAKYNLPQAAKENRLYPSEKRLQEIPLQILPDTCSIIEDIDRYTSGFTVETKEITVCRLSDKTSH